MAFGGDIPFCHSLDLFHGAVSFLRLPPRESGCPLIVGLSDEERGKGKYSQFQSLILGWW